MAVISPLAFISPVLMKAHIEWADTHRSMLPKPV